MATAVRKLGQGLGETFWYEIDGQSYYQKTLVLGQSTMLAPYLDGLSFNDLKPESVVGQLGEQLGRVLEIVLVPKGVSQHTHSLNLHVPGGVDSGESFLSHLTHLDFIQLVEDFFVCNLDISVLERLTVIFQGINKTGTTSEKLNGSAQLLREATQHTEAQSLG